MRSEDRLDWMDSQQMDVIWMGLLTLLVGEGLFSSVLSGSGSRFHDRLTVSPSSWEVSDSDERRLQLSAEAVAVASWAFSAVS